MAKADIVIRDQTYAIACAPGQEDRLLALSKDLDARVIQIADAVGDVGDHRLLLIAALSLLDELEAARYGIATMSAPQIDRAAQALDKAAEHIGALAGRIESEL
jgi:cell division protein ZapA